MIGAEDEVRDALSDELAQLTGNTTFTVVEFGSAGATIWRLYRDENGTPRAEQPRVRQSVLKDPEAFYREVNPVFIMRTAAVLPDNLFELLTAARGVPVYECHASLEAQVRRAITESPLVLGYELAVLKEVPAGRPDAGRLVLAGYPLFPPGVTQGYRTAVRVHCEPTDGSGTVFAVVTRDRRPDIPPSEQVLRPVHIHSAVVPADTYEVTAVLARPGRVLLEGLPAPLSKSADSWDNLKRQVPERLSAAEAVHLVCLVETSGGEDQVELRVDRLSQLIDEAAQRVSRLNVSVVAYGPHSVAWRVDERPVAVRAWAASGTRAIQELRGLLGRGDDDREYLRAAQLECALETVARHLSDPDGRPVIVTAGRRPPHPPAMDTRSTIIPCPDRVNWKWQVDKLASLRATFGALRDSGARGEIWRMLGRDAMATVDDPVDMPDFAARLGLRTATQTVLFPFVD
ncbi:MAG TPA: hypothetical protein VN714_04685 [Trebonia sp.]|jgi:hypothetical protein|nr:hypothetical protein [Trebonia sp.]